MKLFRRYASKAFRGTVNLTLAIVVIIALMMSFFVAISAFGFGIYLRYCPPLVVSGGLNVGYSKRSYISKVLVQSEELVLASD